MAEETKKKKTLWNFVDSLEGDKVVWMIVILLILFSIVAIFSSTSLLALQQKTTRMAITKLSLRKALTAHARYMIMATFTTSKTWTWNPKTETIRHAWLM